MKSNLNEEFKSGFWFGVDDAGETDRDRINFSVLKTLGVQFVVHHLPTPLAPADEAVKVKALMKECEENGVYFLGNVEISNWGGTVIDGEGNDWANGEDGCHYFRVPDSVLAAYNASPYFAGLVYDEAEHMQINRNWVWAKDVSILGDNERDNDIPAQFKKEGAYHDWGRIMLGGKADIPFFGETDGMSFRQASDTFVGYGKRVADGYFDKGTPYLMTEHVWPVLFHSFAKMGFIPGHKQMKEGWSNIWALTALGAARQYGRELWTCIDLWRGGDYPGHSPEELKYNMVFSHLIGCDKSFVENLSYNGSMYTKVDGADVLNEYGKAVRWFTSEYLPANERSCSHRDYMPSTAIIRFDDSDGGQHASKGWPEWLLGSYTLKSSEETREWLRAWHTITHQTTHPDALSWNYGTPPPHRSFAPCNSPIVYDESVGAKDLEGLELVFLCGLEISEGTMAAVSRMVKEQGLTVVTGKRFAPDVFASLYSGGTAVLADGAGKWVITDDMASGEVYEAVRPLLGNKDEMVYRFRDRTITLKISEDGNSFENR